MLFCFRDHYFTAVSWVSLTEISVVWLNRPQNLSIVTICSSPKWDCREVRAGIHYIIQRRPWASLKQEIVCDLIFYETKFSQFQLKAIRTHIRIFNSELGKRKCQLVDDEIFIGLLRCRFDVNCYVGIPFWVDENVI